MLQDSAMLYIITRVSRKFLGVCFNLLHSVEKEPPSIYLKSNVHSNVGTSLEKRTLLNHSFKGNFSTETTVAFLIPQTDEPNHFPWLEILKLTYKND